MTSHVASVHGATLQETLSRYFMGRQKVAHFDYRLRGKAKFPAELVSRLPVDCGSINAVIALSEEWGYFLGFENSLCEVSDEDWRLLLGETRSSYFDSLLNDFMTKHRS